MTAWAGSPVWQNFSSLFREATTAQEARTALEKSHHLTASLYFGIAALEAFLNEKMRDHLNVSKSEEEIVDFLRKGQIISKLKKWPTELLGKTGPFPFHPILCRRWWTSEHQRSCAHVTDAAIDRAHSWGRRPKGALTCAQFCAYHQTRLSARVCCFPDSNAQKRGTCSNQ